MTNNQKLKRLHKAYLLLKEIEIGSPEVNSLLDAEYPEWFDKLSIAKVAILDSSYELKQMGAVLETKKRSKKKVETSRELDNALDFLMNERKEI
jgi:hypothetical protein